MSNGLITVEFIFLCSIQIFTIVFSLIVFMSSLKRYLNTDKSEVFLRKSVKYFTFILITIACAGSSALFVNIFFFITSDGIVSGYLYGSVITSMFVNIFCAWQFLNYLIHPERRITKYPIGICVTIGIVLTWFYPGVMTTVFFSPIIETPFIYIYLLGLYVFVYILFAFEFLRHGGKSFEKKEKYRFFCLGVSALLSLFMFLGFFWGLIYAWLFILFSMIFLYLGYNFPKFFQKALKI
ncbi:MAG: hypothetical protein HWN65_15570 [Candidatus Helarchaeota archaeon]|nr:hypothetical protein [Candidatus Helarchaeota archaeon]